MVREYLLNALESQLTRNRAPQSVFDNTGRCGQPEEHERTRSLIGVDLVLSKAHRCHGRGVINMTIRLFTFGFVLSSPQSSPRLHLGPQRGVTGRLTNTCAQITRRVGDARNSLSTSRTQQRSCSGCDIHFRQIIDIENSDLFLALRSQHFLNTR